MQKKWILLLALIFAMLTGALVYGLFGVHDRNLTISQLKAEVTGVRSERDDALASLKSKQALLDRQADTEKNLINNYNDLAIKYRKEHPNEVVYILGVGPRSDCLAALRPPYTRQDNCPKSN